VHFYEEYRHCPCCGHPYQAGDFDPADTVFRCGSCGYPFYQNAVPSVTAVIPRARDPMQVVLITRMTEPHVGRRALPGGFLRYGETPDQAVLREIREETLLEIAVDRQLCVSLVDYLYRGTRVCVLEHAFLARPVGAGLEDVATGEASCVGYYWIDEVVRDPGTLAFPEHVSVLAAYRRLLAAGLEGPRQPGHKDGRSQDDPHVEPE
jgi:ADP-ribose pyrophosphatase YjhB (NUDIX family)